MKHLLCIALVLFILFTCCACSTTSVPDGETVELRFIYADKNINVVLSDDEGERIIDILDGKIYDPIFSGTPSCGFDENISLRVDGHAYAIACDTCKNIQDCESLRYFSVTQEEIQYIHSLFEKYGGHFPCV